MKTLYDDNTNLKLSSSSADEVLCESEVRLNLLVIVAASDSQSNTSSLNK